MSVSDPLLKELKACTFNFLEDVQNSEYVSETSAYLPQFCQICEKIFSTGLKSYTNSLGFLKCWDSWTILRKISESKCELVSYAYRTSVDHVLMHKNVLLKTGKVRLLIRYCLVNKCLHIPVEYLTQREKKTYYHENSILGDEILAEILLSVLRQCSKIVFKLDVKNASFLDYSWKIPEMIKLELVPCDSLGISVSFAGEKAIIVSMRSNSILAELGKVQIGDVLDNLNGIHISSATKGRLMNILKLSKLMPITVTIIKAFYSDSNQLYPPLLMMLKQVSVDPDVLRNKLFKGKDLKVSPKHPKVSAGHKATYVGWVEIGSKGDVKQINKAAMLLVSPYPKQTYSDTELKKIDKEILFEIGELGVKVLEESTMDIVLKHSYMEISSCGSISFLHNYFAYVAGDQDCNFASKFTCHIFQARTSDICYTILQSIGQGFQRTHFAV